MIAENISKLIADAMKAKDEIRLSTLKLLSSELHNAKIAKQKDLTQEEELEVVRREAKKRKDAIEAYKKAGANDRAEREKQELEILDEYLPQQMPDSELAKVVKEAISLTGASSMSDVGKVMGTVMAKVKGKAEGGRVSEIVRKNLL